MSARILIALAVAAALLIALVWCISRMNKIEETNEDEPVGDMIDVKAFLQRWEDRR
jgi:hypothetical protein